MNSNKGRTSLRTLGLTGCMLVLGWLSPGPGSTAVQMVDVCHIEGNGSFHLITVASQAVPAHLNHGDALPGDPVPGNPGLKFDDTCQEVPASTCPCQWDAATLAGEGIDFSTMHGGICSIDPNVGNIIGACVFCGIGIQVTLTQDTSGQCITQNPVNQIQIIINGLTSSQAQDCLNDLRNVAPSLGVTCP